MIQAALFVIALCWWCVPQPAQAQDGDNPPPAERPIIDEAGKVIGKVEKAPKEFKVYVREKLEEADQEPWRETADEVLIHQSQVRWHRYIRSLANAPEWLDIGFEQRMRYETLTNNFRQGDPENINGGAFRTRLRVGADWKIFRLFVESQNSSDVGSDEGLTGNFNSTLFSRDRLLQAFFAVKLDNVLDTGLRADLHVGRMTLDFGHRRLIARNEFRNTTNAFNGLHLNLAQAEFWRMRAFVVKPISDTFGVIQPIEDTLFWGVQYEERRDPWLNMDLYYFGINGGKEREENRTFGTYGIRAFRSSAPAQMDYEIESVFQKGTRGGLDHFAHFQHAEIGYTFDVSWLPRMVVQYDYASGTANPNGQTSHTFDTLFGARRFEYTPTGIFGPFFRSNLSTPGVRLEFRPRSDMSIMAKYRAWYLAQSQDAWVGSGLQDSSGASGNFLGQDVELRVQWQWGTYMLFDMGYDHYFKGSYVENLPRIPGNPSAQDSDYFYFQTELRF